MRLLDVTEVKLERLDLSNLHYHKPRPSEIIPGCTVITTILRYIATTIGTLQRHQEDLEDPELRPWRMIMGMGWETHAAQLYPEMIWQPKTLKHNNVQGHPDGYSFINND